MCVVLNSLKYEIYTCKFNMVDVELFRQKFSFRSMLKMNRSFFNSIKKWISFICLFFVTVNSWLTISCVLKWLCVCISSLFRLWWIVNNRLYLVNPFETYNMCSVKWEMEVKVEPVRDTCNHTFSEVSRTPSFEWTDRVRGKGIYW